MNSNNSVAVDPIASPPDPPTLTEPAAVPTTSNITINNNRDSVYTFSDNGDSDDDACDAGRKYKTKNIPAATPAKDADIIINSSLDNNSSGILPSPSTKSPTENLNDAALSTSDREDADNFQGFTPPKMPATNESSPSSSSSSIDGSISAHLLMQTNDRTSPPAGKLPTNAQPESSSSNLSPLPPAAPMPSEIFTAADFRTSNASLPNPPVAAASAAIPKTGGKPLTFASGSAAKPTPTAGTKSQRSAGGSTRTARPKPNRKVLVTMYQSQISDNTLGGIKLKLKKHDMATALAQTANAVAATITGRGATSKPRAPRQRASASVTTTTKKRATKRAAHRTSDNDDDDDEDDGGGGGSERKSRKTPANKTSRTNLNNNNLTASDATPDDSDEPQSDWGLRLPEPVLYRIFQEVIRLDGVLPTVVRLGRVCSLWNRVSLAPSLWTTLDFARWTKEKHRTELRLKWLIENRCSACVDLNLSNWKITNVHCVLSLMAESCPKLTSVTFAGWKSFLSDDMLFMAEQFQSLRRVDLSSINFETSHKAAVSLQALCLAIQLMKDRLTHLYLAHNKLAGIPQIVTALATFCPNLQLLDLSNVTTVANSHGVLHLEKLQTGCPKLKVLRITNSHITLGAATLEEQMGSPGFVDLEELSIAALSDESRLINDEYLQRILKTSTKLQLLDVRGCARLTHESMIRLPAWDLKHLFLSGCMVTRDLGSGLELIASKWAHSLTEFDLAWANVQQTIDDALRVIAEKGRDAAISHLNLCGSSVSEEAVKEVLHRCPQLVSINLSSCRGLPRGVKRLMSGTAELNDLRETLGVPVPMVTQ